MTKSSGWRQLHAERMRWADGSKMGPELLFDLYADFERLGPDKREDAIRELSEEILGADNAMAFDAQAIAVRFALTELAPSIEERILSLSVANTPEARAELLTSQSFLRSLGRHSGESTTAAESGSAVAPDVDL